MIDIKNKYKLALFLPASTIINVLIVLVFIKRRNISNFDYGYFLIFLVASLYSLCKVILFIWFYLEQRKKLDLAEIEESALPSLTVIVPAWNEEDVIGATLKSLQKVDYPGLRCIVVDDGSTDRTPEIIQQNLRNGWLCIRQKNAGKAKALTHGISLSETEYTLLVDADCLFPPDSFRQAIRYIVHHQDHAVGGALSVANKHGLLSLMQGIEYAEDTLLFRRFLSRIRWRWADRTQDVIPGALGLFETRALKSMGPLCGDVLAEDVELTSRLVAANYRLSFCPYLLAETVVPETLNALKKQRKRWVQGYLQVAIMQLQRWRQLSTRSRYYLLSILHKITFWPIMFTLEWLYLSRAIIQHDWYFLSLVLLAHCFPFSLSGLTRFCNHTIKAHLAYGFLYSHFLLATRTYFQVLLRFQPRPQWEKYNRFAIDGINK